jgi:hypothetical protein
VFKNFFEARDELDRAVLAGDIKLPEMPESRRAAVLAIFRFLLSHTFYDGYSYGFVNRKVCGADTLVELTGFSLSTVKRSLTALVEARLIHRRPCPMSVGGSNPDEIAIAWSVFHAEDEAEGVTENLSDQAKGVTVTAEGVTENLSFQEKKLKNRSSSRRADDDAASSSEENRAKSSIRSVGTARSGSTHPAISPAKDEYPVDPGALDDLTGSINEFLDDFAVPYQVPFSFSMLRRDDQSRVPGLIMMLHREDSFYAEDLIWGLVKQRGDSLEKIGDGAKWLGSVLRGVSEAELRKWIARGKDYFAAHEHQEREEAERAEREEAERQAEEAAEEAQIAELAKDCDRMVGQYAELTGTAVEDVKASLKGRSARRKPPANGRHHDL